MEISLLFSFVIPCLYSGLWKHFRILNTGVKVELRESQNFGLVFENQNAT